jgi:pimeloyl-ACP methyl ester carboxylesterase
MSTMPPEDAGTLGSLTSKDGTKLGFRQVGRGPGLVLIQGAMGTEHNFSQLAGLLADAFTVYLPDRRGRGLSPLPYSPDYTVRDDVDDLDALLGATKARNVFGLSSGAIIALEAAKTMSAIFEPPLLLDGVDTKLTDRFYRELERGDIPAALVSAMKAAQLTPRLFNVIPRPLLELLTRLGLAVERIHGTGEYASMRELAASLPYDIKVAVDATARIDSFRDVKTDVLLIGGSKSPTFLKAALGKLETILPNAKRVEISGSGMARPGTPTDAASPMSSQRCSDVSSSKPPTGSRPRDTPIHRS